MGQKLNLKIKEQRLCREFTALTSVDSVSFGERRMADLLKERLEALGFEVKEDDAGERIGGSAGNLYGFLKGELPDPGVLFSAHMDTVQPGFGKKAIFGEDGTITSGGDTVLGADDVTGIVEILEGIRAIREAGIPHRDIEVLFSIAEEVYCKGAEAFEFSGIHAKEAYVLDLSGPVGTAALQAPTLISFTVTVTGKSAHAGFNPEDGIHAIRTMCRAAAGIAQGHIDEQTTLNIGQISGGEATNIVPSVCTCRGEIRSYSHSRALAVLEEVRRQFEQTAGEDGAGVSLESCIDLTAYRVREDAPAVTHFRQACARLGFPCQLTSTFGGSDNNPFLQHGIEGIVLSCGMYNVHSVHEYAKTVDLVNGARMVAELI